MKRSFTSNKNRSIVGFVTNLLGGNQKRINMRRLFISKKSRSSAGSVIKNLDGMAEETITSRQFAALLSLASESINWTREQRLQLLLKRC